MTRPPAPVYLEKRTYRRRRLVDAVRLLPILGIILFLLPILWTPSPENPAQTSNGYLYLFAIWVGMIAVTAILVSYLNNGENDDEEPGSS